MHSKDTVTEFLNVDLDIHGEPGDVESFLNSIAPSVVVLNHNDQDASIELAQDSATLEETVTSLVQLVGALPPNAKDIWNRLEFRKLNVGIQAAYEPHAACFVISGKTVALLAPLQFEIVFTVYAPRAD